MAVTDHPTFVRADGPDKVTGSGRYTADLTLTGMLVGKFLYAGVAHARITKLDVTAAKAIPGVFSVLTSADVPDVLYSYGVSDRRLFAKDFVRFEGEVVAGVAAINEEVAQQALDAIVFEYDELPVVRDLEAAVQADSPLVHEGWADYPGGDDMGRDGNVVQFSSVNKGDATAALDSADHVVTSRYESDASHAAPIEPRAVVAQWEGEKVTIWTSTQVPFEARDGVCETLELPVSAVRIIVPHMGGGFGGKCGFHYEAHIAAMARAAKRPVKLVFSRYEEFIAPDRRREGMIFDITTGVMNDGTIVARTGEILVDNGAYMADSAFFPQVAAMHIAGPYKMDACRINARLVYTNTQPSGSVRAPTAPQACWAVESHTDEVAAAIGMDPAEFRLKNVVRTGDEGPIGQIYDEIGAAECIETAVASMGDTSGLAENEAVGVAIGWWPSFASPAGAFVKLHADGTAQLITGAQENGTGSVMTLRMLVADEVGIDQTDVALIYQDTGTAPAGPGSSGSQTLFNHGRASEDAAKQVGDRLRELAAAKLEASAADIVLEGGQASVAGTPTKAVSIAELAAESPDGEILGAAGRDPGEWPEIPAGACIGDQGMGSWMAPQFSCHVAKVRVDPDTGVARVVEVHTAHDSGTIVNPLAAHGQVEGGVMMGVGQALTEGTVYGDDGRQLNAAMLEYKLTTIADAPKITTTFVEVFTPNAGPRGAKGLAEAPNVATAGAISNAIAKIAGSHVHRLPMTAERVWMTMSGGGAA